MMMLSNGLSTAGLGIYGIRAARRIIDWSWIVPEEIPPGQEPSQIPEAEEDHKEAEVSHAA